MMPPVNAFSGRRRHGMEVRSIETLDELLRRDRNRPPALQHHPYAKGNPATAPVAATQALQVLKGSQGQQVAEDKGESDCQSSASSIQVVSDNQ